MRRIFAVVAATALVGTVALGSPGGARAYTIWVADLTGDEEVPGPGDPDGVGYAELDIDPESGRVCAYLVVEDIDAPIAAHVHEGEAGSSGAVVITLPTPTEGEVDGCVDELDPALLQAIVDDPDAYYVNVHTDAYPDGAVRGQLGALELTEIVVVKLACPPDVTLEDIQAGNDEDCIAAWREGDFELEPGYSWAVEPVEFDMDVEVTDDLGSLTIDDAVAGGGGTCNPGTLLCQGFRTYTYQDVLAGPVTVTELTFPEGYSFAWATVVREASTEEPVGDAVVDVESASVSFEADGAAHSFTVVLYDLADLPAATDPPATPPPTPSGPTGGSSPTVRITPPPTSSLDDRSSAAGATLVPIGLLVVVSGAVLVASLRRRHTPR